MSDFIPVIILIVVALIILSFQLSAGVFTLFYHYNLGRHTTQKTDDYSLDFILGTETFSAFIWLILYALFYILLNYNISFNTNIIIWILSGMMAAESILIMIFYYKKGVTTALFITRKNATNFITHAKTVNKRSDAYILGLISAIPETVFSLPLYLTAMYILLNTGHFPATLFIIIYILLSTIPLFIIRMFYRTGKNLVWIERFRIKTKPLIRIALVLGYFIIACLLVCMGVLNNG